MTEFENGTDIRVFQLDTDEQGDYWAHWFDGEYLTTENVGNGREIRIKNKRTGKHIHLNPNADDIKITQIQ